MFLPDGIVGLLFQCAEFQGRRFIHAGHGVAHGGNQGAGCSSCANFKGGVFAEVVNLRQRDVCG